MYSATSVTDILNDNNGKEYNIKVKRNGNYKEFSLKPAYSSAQGATRSAYGSGTQRQEWEPLPFMINQLIVLRRSVTR